ncbi:hypothetical protein HDU93_008346 [Gonapodya sp. JEL0774]|nr:hypothetical protein HDU93_008346 [Gonapodya sp. JEL0774]
MTINAEAAGENRGPNDPVPLSLTIEPVHASVREDARSTRPSESVGTEPSSLKSVSTATDAPPVIWPTPTASIATTPPSSPDEESSDRLLDIQDSKAETQIESSLTPPERSDFLLYGRIHQSGGLEAVHSHRLSQKLLLVNTAFTAWGKEPKGHFHSQLAYATSSASSQLTYDSDSSTFGLSTLFNLGSPFGGLSQLAAGGEVYYVADERSGGIACGFRARQTYPMAPLSMDSGTLLAAAAADKHAGAEVRPSRSLSTTTQESLLDSGALSVPSSSSSRALEATTTNPDHSDARSYTSTVAPGADVSARYDLNVYSYDSDLAVGVEWAPLGRGEMVKFGVGKEGIRLLFQKLLPRAVVSFGVLAGWGDSGRRDVGVEVQIV